MGTNKKFGHTLLEVVISMTLLVVGVMALVLTLGTSQNTVFTAQKIADANRAATIVLETLRGDKHFETLYTRYSGFNFTNLTTAGPFFVMEDGRINWNPVASTPNNPPAGAVGYGWMNFVVKENGGYSTVEWGTETAWTTGATNDADGDGVKDGIDLDGDGNANRVANMTSGRTQATALGTWNLYTILPVKITIRIFQTAGSSTFIEVIKRGWITNSYEK